MNFFIKKNSTLPILKVEVFKDGRTSYKEFDKLLSASTITFSMKNSETDVYVILDSPATLDIVKDTDGETVRYLLSYQLSKRYTKKIGEFIGEFKIDNYQGNAILPIRKTLYVNVIESFSLTDLCCKPNVPPPRPTGTPLPSLTPTPSNPPQIQCDGSISASGGRGYYTVDAQLGTDVGTVTVEFESYNIPDRFMIYWDNQIVADSLFIGDGLINNYNQYGPEILNTTSLPKKQWDGSNFVNVGTEYVSFTTDDITNCSFTRFQANTQPQQIGVDPNFPAPTVNNCEGRVKLSFFKPTAFPTNISIVVIGCNANTGWDLVNLQCPVALTPTPTVTPSTTPNYFLECASVIKDFYLECGSGVVEFSPTPTPSPTSTPNFQPPTGIYTVFARFNLFNPIPTLTPTPSITSTVTPTISLTPSITPSISLTPSLTPTISPTSSLTPTQTPTNTPSITPTKPQYVMDCYTEFGVFEVTPTPTVSPTPTVTPTQTPTNTPTQSITPTVTTTVTPTPSITSTIPITPTVTPTNTVTPTQTQTPTITPTNTTTPTITPTQTVTPTNIQVLDVNFGVIFESGSTKSTFFITASQPVVGNLRIDFANIIYDRFDGTEVRSTVSITLNKGQISGSTTIINGYDYDRIEPYQASYDKIRVISNDVIVNNINKYDFVEFKGKTKPTEVNYQFISCCGGDFKDLIVAPTSQWVVDDYGVVIDGACYKPFKQGGSGSDGYYYGPDFKTCSDKVCPSCSTSTPTPTVSITPSITPTITPTSTNISKITPTPTNTPTSSITSTQSMTPTQTQTPTITPTSSVTLTPTNTPTTSTTQTPSVTPTNTQTQTPTNTPTTSITQTPSVTPTQTQTPTVTVTSGLSPTPTPSNTPTPSITSSITPTQTITPTNTQTQTPSNTPTTSITQTPSITPTLSVTSTPSNTPTQTPTTTPSVTPTQTPSITPTITPSVTPTQTPSITPTQTPSVTSSVTPTQTASVTPTITPTSSIRQTPRITPTNTTTPSVTPTEQVLPVSGYYFYYDPGDKNSYNGTGTTLRDLSGNKNNAFIANGPSHTSGEGGYFTLDGVNEYILSPSIFDGSNESHTLEVWVYLSSLDNCIWSDLGQTIINDSYHFAGSQFYAIGQTNYVITSLWDSTSVFKVDNYTGTISPLGVWQQIVRVYDGTRLYSYRNGNLVNFATVSFDSPYDDGLTDWRIAFGAEDSTTYNATTANFLDGRYGVIRYYKSALNATEILQNYNSDKSKYGL